MAQFEVVCSNTAGTITLNYQELKEELQVELKNYKMQVTEENLQEAKTNRAKLNKLAKALNDKKIEVKKTFNEPYIVFENQVKDLIGMIKESSDAIDTQVKVFDQRETQKKKDEIGALWEAHDQYDIQLEKIFNQKWLNKTYKLEEIEKEMIDLISQIEESINFIDMQYKDEFDNSEVKAIYLQCLSLPQATIEADRRQKARAKVKEEQEQKLKEMHERSAQQAQAEQPKQNIEPVQKPVEKAETPNKKRVMVQFIGNEEFFNEMNAIINKHRQLGNLTGCKVLEREEM